MSKAMRWLRGGLAAVLAAALILPAQAAPAGEDFASFLIDGEQRDFTTVTLAVDIYRPGRGRSLPPG